MSLDLVLFIAGVLLSAVFSWFFTHIYYKKSLRQQEETAKTQIGKLTDALVSQNKTDAALLMQKRIEESIAEHRRAGTPIRVIDTYNDLSNKEKAEMLDTVLLRIRGRKANQNKYRE
ncbi:MAG: hypothetical protein WAT67_11230 [Candidatus Contendobacter sp.]